MANIEEVLGDLDTYPDERADFELLPDGTMIVARIQEATSKRDGAICLVSKAEVIPANLSGHYGTPRLWDHMGFLTPKVPDPTLPEDELKKAKGKVGAWARRVRAVGLDPKALDTAKLTEFYSQAIGHSVIIRVGIQPAQGSYKAKNVARDYYPDSTENRTKYGLTQVLGRSSTTFNPEEMEL